MCDESFRTALLMRYPKEIKPDTGIIKSLQNRGFAATFFRLNRHRIPGRKGPYITGLPVDPISGVVVLYY